MKAILTKITNGDVLTRQDTCNMIHAVVEQKINDVQLSAFLTALIMRGIKVDELLGLRDGILETGKPVDLSPYDVIDIVGTGGDNKNTFNISTCSCFVVAGAGYKVAKHGNYAATSTSGASNVIEQHGVKFTGDHDTLIRSIEESGVCYIHAPLFATGMKYVAPVRKMLGIPTCFNLLGPLVNPARPKYQLLGVAQLKQMRLYSSVYERLGMSYGIINSIDGYDEISLTSSFKVKTPSIEKVYKPSELGFNQLQAGDLFGGETPQEAALIFDNILNGTSTQAQKDVVMANAAFAIKVMEPQISLDECIDKARTSLESKKALECFKTFVAVNS